MPYLMCLSKQRKVKWR